MEVSILMWCITFIDNLNPLRGHVAYDILPYSCVFEDCSSPREMYLTREDWIHHMKMAHSIKEWLCEYCSSLQDKGQALFTYSTADDLESHLKHSHATKSSSVLPLHILVDNSVRYILPKVNCPLCPGEETIYELETSLHVAHHLHSLAMNALPWEDIAPETGSSPPDLGSGKQTNDVYNLLMKASSGSHEDQEGVLIQDSMKNEAPVPLWIESTQISQGGSESAQAATQAPVADRGLGEVDPPKMLLDSAIPRDDAAPKASISQDSGGSSPKIHLSQESVAEEPRFDAKKESVTTNEENPDRGRSRTRSSNPRSRTSQIKGKFPDPTLSGTDKRRGVFDSIPNYRLRKSTLMEYLRALFPDFPVTVLGESRTDVNSPFFSVHGLNHTFLL